jgi:hypothetical protein
MFQTYSLHDNERGSFVSTAYSKTIIFKHDVRCVQIAHSTFACVMHLHVVFKHLLQKL